MRHYVRMALLLAASIVALGAGALFAANRVGVARLLLAGGGFSGYLFLFARALRPFGLRWFFVEGGPGGDPERAPEAAERTVAARATRPAAPGFPVPDASAAEANARVIAA